LNVIVREYDSTPLSPCDMETQWHSINLQRSDLSLQVDDISSQRLDFYKILVKYNYALILLFFFLYIS